MPQALVFTLMGAGMYAGYRFARALSRASQMRQAQSAKPEPTTKTAAMREMGTLQKDPRTGVYRSERS